MNIDRKLINEALSLVKREKIIQGKIINAINEKNYTLASYLVAVNDKVCEETDKLIKDLVLNLNSKDMVELNDVLEDMAAEKYGENCSEGKSLSLLVSNALMDTICKGEIIESDTFGEELCYIIHSLAVDKYLSAKDGLYKEEMLEHINNNISNSYALRALFRGDNERFEKYNPDLYFDPIEMKLVGEDYVQTNMLITCIMIEDINSRGYSEFLKLGFSKDKIKNIMDAQKDMEKIKIASYYIQSKERGYDLGLDYSKFSNNTKDDIKSGVDLGEKECKRFIKR